MKKTVTLIILFIITISSYGQEENNCVNKVDTHPDVTPTQNHLEALPRAPGNSSTHDERFINGWEWWMDPLNPNVDYNIPIRDMQMSASQIYEPYMEPINSNLFGGHYNYLRHTQRDVMLPEDGWELIAQNRGWYPDNDAEINWSQNTGLRSIPYLLFYNKYSGIARVFVRYGDNTDPDSDINFADIRIIYDNPNAMSGILRLADGLDRALDLESIIQQVTVRVPSPGDAHLWFSADFQLTFDPCVCQHESEFDLSFTFFKESEIILTGRSVTVEGELTEDNYMTSSEIHDYLAGVNSAGEKAQGGYLIYKRQLHLINDYLRVYEEYKKKLDAVNKHNKKVERNLAILKIAQTAIATGVTAVTGIPSYTSLLGLIPELKDIADGSFFGPKTQKEFWKQLDKVLNESSTLLIKENFSNFVKEDKPSKPTMPTVAHIEFSASGTLLSSTSEKRAEPIKTPGSLNSSAINVNRPNSYPIYDEALGVFALLEKPEIKISEIVEDRFFYLYPEYNASELIFNHSFQFSLNKNLKYAFNSALPIEKYDIQSSFVIESSRIPGLLYDSISYSVSYDSTSTRKFDIINNYTKTANVNSISYPVEELSVLPDAVVINSVYVPIDALNNLVGGFSNFYKINCVGTLGITCPYMGDSELEDFPHLGIDDIYLKLLINVTYEGEKSDGTPHEYTYMFTYKVDDIVIDNENPIYPNLPGSAGDITQYPEFLNLTGANFNGASVEGCKLTGTSYLCKAIEDISVSGTYTVAQGYEVNVEAGNEINIAPETLTPPEMQFSIVPVYDYSNPMPPVDAPFVKSFCSSTGTYSANLSKNAGKSMMSGGSEESEDTEIEMRSYEQGQEEMGEFYFDLYPNPTSGGATVEFLLTEQAKVNLYVTELSGKVVLSQLSERNLFEGKQKYALNTETLSNGIYLVVLQINGVPNVVKLIKN